MKFIRLFVVIWFLIILINLLFAPPLPAAKPVIYIYPEQPQEVSVKLDYDGDLFATYPDYDKELWWWNVTASPDGTLIYHGDGEEYSYLFREGHPAEATNRDLSKWFVVKGSDTKKFLQKTLKEIGLTPKEYNEFIVYWFPMMQDNPYNLIHFAKEEYTDTAKLEIEPKEDSMLRVFMVWKPLKKKIKIEPQHFEKFERNGFTVVEWWGTKLNSGLFE